MDSAEGPRATRASAVRAMDLLALGTPVIDLTARATDARLARLSLKKGSTNFVTARRLSAIERSIGKEIIHRYPGDNARNVCEGFASLGGSCGFLGAVGRDKEGEQFCKNLKEKGIANLTVKAKGKTGKIIVLITPDGERTFCADLGVSTGFGRFDRNAISAARMFFAPSITLAEKGEVGKLAMNYLRAFKKSGKKIALSLESPLMVAKKRRFLLSALEKYADFIFMNEEEARALLGAGAEGKLARLKPSALVFLKRGRRGSSVFAKSGRRDAPAIRARAIDSTGAGDAYVAGALYGISRGYSARMGTKFGSLLGAKVVGKIGAGIPPLRTG